MDNSLHLTRKIQLKELEILKVFQEICRRHNLRYFAIGGTCLGAVRHKGFIPWDNDVDLIMPLPDIEKLKQVLNSETLMVLDTDTCDYYEYFFPRVCHKLTYNRMNAFNSIYGINIDLYPVVGASEYIREIDIFMEKARALDGKVDTLTKWHKRILRHTPFSFLLPGYHKSINTLHSFVRQYPFEGAKKFYHLGGPFRMYQVFDYDVFESMTEVEFEGYKFKSLSRVDDYLTQVYGDYMTPPPSNQRIPYHTHNYYWK